LVLLLKPVDVLQKLGDQLSKLAVLHADTALRLLLVIWV
jgi:hypothetical protein